MKTIKEMNKSAVPYRMGYKKCKEDVLKLINKADTFPFDGTDLISAMDLKKEIEG